MNCQKCADVQLRVVNTFQGAECKLQRAVCPSCKTVYTLCTAIVNVAPQVNQGADALAKKIKRGEAAVRVEVRKTAEPA